MGCDGHNEPCSSGWRRHALALPVPPAIFVAVKLRMFEATGSLCKGRCKRRVGGVFPSGPATRTAKGGARCPTVVTGPSAPIIASSTVLAQPLGLVQRGIISFSLRNSTVSSRSHLFCVAERVRRNLLKVCCPVVDNDVANHTRRANGQACPPEMGSTLVRPLAATVTAAMAATLEEQGIVPRWTDFVGLLKSDRRATINNP